MKTTFLFLTVCLLASGCDDTKKPLSDPNTSKADEGLVGVWKEHGEDGEQRSRQYRQADCQQVHEQHHRPPHASHAPRLIGRSTANATPRARSFSRIRSGWAAGPPRSRRFRTLAHAPGARAAVGGSWAVAQPGRSVPGTHSAFLPSMRARRMSTSWMVLLSM